MPVPVPVPVLGAGCKAIIRVDPPGQGDQRWVNQNIDAGERLYIPTKMYKPTDSLNESDRRKVINEKELIERRSWPPTPRISINRYFHSLTQRERKGVSK